MEPAETQSLRLEIERSLRGAFDPADVLPRLARLARLAAPASDDGVFANHKLAELLVERDPWRAALYVRRALKHRPDDDRPWAILAFCQTLLRNFRCAATAYRKAIACAPANPWYAHNLGHLLDVALGEPARAVAWLASAYAAKSDNSEIVASYVHALARAGRTTEARNVLDRARDRFDSRELDALLRWLDQGAPVVSQPGLRPSSSPGERGSTATAAAGVAARTTTTTTTTTTSAPRDQKRGLGSSSSSAAGRRQQAPRGPMPKRLARVLTRGLSHLPLDPRQRERALELARDAMPTRRAPLATNRRRTTKAANSDQEGLPPLGPTGEGEGGGGGAGGGVASADVAGLAAAVAYAIVYIDHVPLSQAEVAAPFRVGVADLRGRFAELRAKLDIIRGDARYATTRR